MTSPSETRLRRALPELQLVNSPISTTSQGEAERLLCVDMRQAAIDVFFNPDPAIATVVLAQAAQLGRGKITDGVLDCLIYWPVDLEVDENRSAAEISQGWALSTRAHALRESRTKQRRHLLELSAPSPTSPSPAANLETPR